ncbi:hypothetical protein GE21DRAFT_1017422 [Neurospora crassa]|nr:hypothetical protein GE21DRAFT_1017422 [Neurospora crassa]
MAPWPKPPSSEWKTPSLVSGFSVVAMETEGSGVMLDFAPSPLIGILGLAGRLVRVSFFNVALSLLLIIWTDSTFSPYFFLPQPFMILFSSQGRTSGA